MQEWTDYTLALTHLNYAKRSPLTPKLLQNLSFIGARILARISSIEKVSIDLFFCQGGLA